MLLPSYCCSLDDLSFSSQPYRRFYFPKLFLDTGGEGRVASSSDAGLHVPGPAWSINLAKVYSIEKDKGNAKSSFFELVRRILDFFQLCGTVNGNTICFYEDHSQVGAGISSKKFR